MRSRTTISFSNNKIVVVLEQHCVLKILSENNVSRNLEPKAHWREVLKKSGRNVKVVDQLT